MIKRWLASSTAVSALLLVRAAAAQTQYTAQPDSPEWLKDRRYAEGAGVRAGDFEIHPGIGGEFGYDSNWFLRSTQPNVDNAPVIPALEFRITPSIYLETLQGERAHEGGGYSAPPLMFRFGLNGTYYHLIGISSDPTASNERNRLDRGDIHGGGSFGVGAEADLKIFEGRPVGAGIAATYGRVILPNAAAGNANLSFNQDDITGSAQLNIQPNSGTLDWHFGYTFATALFEQQVGAPFTNISHSAFTRGRWRFRPRTALVYDATADFFYYTNVGKAQQEGLVQSTPFRTRIGLSGLVTERFGVLALIGWGASFDRVANPLMQQYDQPIANAEIKWYLAASPGIARATDLGLTLSSIALGYTRDFQNSYIGNFYGTDRGYLKFNYFFAGRALVGIEGGVGAIEYPHLFWVNPAAGGRLGRLVRTDAGSVTAGTGFSDVRADLTILGEYRFSNVFAMNSTFRYTQNFSDKALEESPTLTGATPVFFGMAWQRFEVFLGLRLFL
jgi:hypothetical protein